MLYYFFFDMNSSSTYKIDKPIDTSRHLLLRLSPHAIISRPRDRTTRLFPGRRNCLFLHLLPEGLS